MDNEQTIKIYPEMQEKRLQQLIHKGELDLKQLELLEDQYVRLDKINREKQNIIMYFFSSIVKHYKSYNKTLSMRESETIKIDQQALKALLKLDIAMLIRNIRLSKNNILNFEKQIPIPPSIYKENINNLILAKQINQQKKEAVKVIFEKLIKLNPEQSELLKFVSNQPSTLDQVELLKLSNQQFDPIKLIVKSRKILHKQLDSTFLKMELLKSIYIIEIKERVISKFCNVIYLKLENQITLKDKLGTLKYKSRFDKNHIKWQRLQVIAPNIVIQNLYPFDLIYPYGSSEFYCCLEYHTDNKNLFFVKFKIKDNNNRLERYGRYECTDFTRTKIEHILLENVSEFCALIREFINFKKQPMMETTDPIAICHKFFEEKPIEQILVDNELVKKPDNDIVSIYDYLNNKQVGFVAIKTVKGNKLVGKVIFLQIEVNKDDKSKKSLHVVECGELSLENDEIMFINNKIRSLLRSFSSILKMLFNEYNKKTNKEMQCMEPIDIIKNRKVVFDSTGVKFGPNDPEIKHYDEHLEIKYKPFDINDQTENLDDDNITKKHIERYMNIQNTLRNIHIAGGSTNTLLKMPYYCVDGLEVKNNLPIVPVGDIIAPKMADGANGGRDAIKNAYQKAFDELVDKSLENIR